MDDVLPHFKALYGNEAVDYYGASDIKYVQTCHSLTKFIY